MESYTCLKCELVKDCTDKEHFTRHMVEYHQLNPMIPLDGELIKHVARTDVHISEFLFKDENGNALFLIKVARR